MPVRTACSSCGKKLQIRDELVGKKVKCPACGTAFVAVTAAAGEAVKAGAPRPGPSGKDAVSAKPPAKKALPPRDEDDDDEDSEDRPVRGKKSKENANSKTLLIGIGAAVAVAVVGAGMYFLLFSGSAPVKTAAPAAAPAQKNDKKPSLASGSVPLADLIPGDAWFFASMSTELQKAPIFEKIKKTLGSDAWTKSFDMDSSKVFGIPEADVERLSMFTIASYAELKKNPNNPGHIIVVVQTNKPFQPAVVVKAVKNGDMGRVNKMTTEFMTDQTLLLGTTADIKAYKSRDKVTATGVLEKSITTATDSKGIVASLVVPPEMAAELPPTLGPFLKAKAIFLTLDLDERLALNLSLTADDDAAARGIKKAADDALAQLNSFLDLAAKMPEMANLVPQGRSALGGIRLGSQDKVVSLNFQMDAAKLEELAMGAIDKIRNPPTITAQAIPPTQPNPDAAAGKDPAKARPATNAASQNFPNGKFGGKKNAQNVNPNNPNPINPKFPTPVPPLPGEVSKIAGILNPYLGALIDVETNNVLLLLPSGHAKLYAYPEFTALGTFKLGAGPAYRSVHDKANGRVFALSPNLKGKDPPATPGGSQVVIYAIRDLLEGKLKKNSELAPSKTIELGGFCTHLCLSPDAETLYALDTGNPKAIKVLRVSVANGKVDGNVRMPEYTGNLSMARDGKTLYALSHLTPHSIKAPSPVGAILVIDPETMTLTNTVNIPIDPSAMEVTKEGIIFVSGFGGIRTDIAVINIGKRIPVMAMWRGVLPGSCLKLSEDQKFLYVSNWRGTPATVGALAIPDMLAGSALPSAKWTKSPYAAARGEMLITPDNRFLLCDSGYVFLLQPADQAGVGQVAPNGAP